MFGPNYGETKVQTYIPLFDMLKVPYGGRLLFHVLAKIIRTSSVQYGGPKIACDFTFLPLLAALCDILDNNYVYLKLKRK